MSCTTQLLHHITLYRNPNGSEYEWTKLPLNIWERPKLSKVIVAEVGYIAIIPFAIIETALSKIVKFFASLFCFDRAQSFSATWYKNSLTGLLWSLADAYLNLSTQNLLVYPKHAHKCIQSKNFLVLPELELRDEDLLMSV